MPAVEAKVNREPWFVEALLCTLVIVAGVMMFLHLNPEKPTCLTGPKGDPGQCESVSQEHIFAAEGDPPGQLVVRFTRLAEIVFMHTEPLDVMSQEPWNPVISIGVPKCMSPYWDQHHMPLVWAACEEQGVRRACGVTLQYRHPSVVRIAWDMRGNGTGIMRFGGFSLTWPTYKSVQCKPCPEVNE